MRIEALTLAVLATTASLAAAEPVREETTERISYNQRGKPQPTVTPRAAGWIELASATPAAHGREFVEVGADAGTFTQLRISAATGRPEIHTVQVDFQDGGHRVFHVDRVVDARHRAAYLPLRGAHELKQIVVWTDRASAGSYVLEGNTGDSGVAVR
jgi:hypothetical protein